MSVYTAAAKKVTVIPADPQYSQRDIRKQHLRVAPYCRVSTDSDEQLTSYRAQIEYYTAKIAENPDWTMVRMYADEGTTGTSMKGFTPSARTGERASGTDKSPRWSL